MRSGSSGLKPMVWQITFCSAQARPRSEKVFWSRSLVRPSPMSTSIFWCPSSAFLSMSSPSCTASGTCTARAADWMLSRLSSAATFLGEPRGTVLCTTSVKATSPAMVRASMEARSRAPPAITSGRAGVMVEESWTSSTRLSIPLASALFCRVAAGAPARPSTRRRYLARPRRSAALPPLFSSVKEILSFGGVVASTWSMRS